MTSYILRRALQAIPTILGISFISFLLMLLAPGDPVSRFILNPEMNTESLDRMRRELGLDQPALTQYLYWMIGNDWVMIDLDGDGTGDVQGERRGLLRGDLGQSFQHRRPVLDLILERVEPTLRLTVPALLLGYGLGILLGSFAAAFRGTWFDQLIRTLSVVGIAIPSFWFALILIIVFSVKLQWLPIGGTRDLSGSREVFDLWGYVRYMILPVSVLALGTLATVTRFMRASVLEVIEQDYVRTARAKGLSERQIFNWHVVRNALIPVATLFGPAVGGLISGAVIIEQIFSWPGMGRLVINAIFQRDFPVIMGSVLMGALLYIVGLLLSDILYGFLDPRIRF